jgi:hypothetical protein
MVVPKPERPMKQMSNLPNGVIHAKGTNATKDRLARDATTLVYGVTLKRPTSGLSAYIRF